MDAFLISAKTVREITNISDNMQDKFLQSAIREAQDTKIQTVIGTKLYKKIQQLITDDEISLEENEKYKLLLDSYIKYALAYFTLSNLCILSSYKLDNIGLTTTSDDKVQNVSIKDAFQFEQYYEDKANFYVRRLQDYLYKNHGLFPELDSCQIDEIHSQLYSANSSNIWLGGKRGKGLFASKNICHHDHLNGTTIKNKDMLIFEQGVYKVPSDYTGYGKLEIDIPQVQIPNQDVITVNGNGYHQIQIAWDENAYPVYKTIYVEVNSATDKYTVRFLESEIQNQYYNHVISEEEYDAGATITVPDAPQRDGYTFAGWDKDVSPTATSNITYKAVYERNTGVTDVTLYYADNSTETLQDVTILTKNMLPSKSSALTGIKIGHRVEGMNAGIFDDIKTLSNVEIRSQQLIDYLWERRVKNRVKFEKYFNKYIKHLKFDGWFLHFGEFNFSANVYDFDVVTGNDFDGFGSCVFSNSNITSVTIGTSILYIVEYAFSYCPKLTDVYYNGTKAEWAEVWKDRKSFIQTPAKIVHCTDGDINIKN